MSQKDIQIKVRDAWWLYSWDSSDGTLYATGLSPLSRRGGREDTKVGNACSLQAAIVQAKARCGAGRHHVVNVRWRAKLKLASAMLRNRRVRTCSR